MPSLINSIRNNVLSVSFSQFASLLLNIITFGIAARALGIEDFGYFNFLLALLGVLAKIIDLGVNPIVFRETSKSKKFNIISTIFTAKLILLSVVIIVTNILLFSFQYDPRKILILNLLVLNVVLSNKYTAFRELLVMPFKVNLKMHLPALIVLVDNLLLLFMTFFLNYFDDKLLVFSIFYLISNLPGTIILIFILRKHVTIKLKLDFKKFNKIVQYALPIWGYVLLTIVIMQGDTIMLKYLQGEYAVGIYAVALRLSMPLVVIPSAITMTFFPIIVEKIEKGNDYKEMFNVIIKILAIFSTLLFVAIFSNSSMIISIIFGSEYIVAKEPLFYLLSSMIPFFVSFFLLDYFTASNLQKLTFYFAAIQIVLVFPLYYFLIPQYSYNGAAFARLITLLLACFFLFWNLNNDKKFDNQFYILLLWSVLTVVITIFLPVQINSLMGSVLIIGFSVALLFIFRLIGQAEIKYLKSLLRIQG